MLHAWPFIDGGEWNSPAWSISAEWFAYLFVFPLFWKLLGYPGFARFSGIAMVFLLFFWLGIEYSHFQLAASFSHIMRVSFEFAIGCLLFSLHDRGHQIVGFCQKYLSYLIVLLLVLIFLLPNTVSKGLVILFIPAILLGLTCEISLVAKMLSLRPMIWLGNISYAIYMVHMVSWQCLKRILPAEHYLNSTPLVRVGLAILYLAAILASAALLYYLVEQPTRNRLRHLWHRIHSHSAERPNSQPLNLR